ncbi:PQQ-binding-like beta-propeller repeat protein [Candidatus Woesearchaeota archaeon]|nr:PQQ-binding-like beta-propeller repeat protein [Candidatus Woesearchaeota archaeon]
MKKVLYLILLIICMNVANAQLADSPWPMFHGSIRGTGLSEHSTAKVDGSILWSFETSGGIETSPAIGEEGTIYIADDDCKLYAVNPDGTQKWVFKGGEPVTSKEWGGYSCSQSSPSVAHDGTIYYANMAGYLYAVNSEGKEKWRYPVFMYKNIWSSPAIGPDGTIYIGSELYPPRETGKPEEGSAKVYAIKPDGTLKWAYDLNSAWSTSTAVIGYDGTIYTTGSDGANNMVNTVFAFSPNGKVKWKFVPKDGVVEGSIALGADDTLYFGAKGEKDPRKGKFYALTKNGKEIWSVALNNGMSVAPAIDGDGNVYFGDWGGVFYAFDSSGKELWRAETPPAYEALSSSPAMSADGTIYFGSTGGYFFAYTTKGKERWRFWEEHGGIVASPAIGKNNVVYVAAVPGKLYAVGSGSGVFLPEGPEGNLKGIEEDSCPHHVYGTEEEGFYGAFYMSQKDLTDDDVEWIKHNCPTTTWPEHMGGYEWMLDYEVKEESLDKIEDSKEGYCGDGICSDVETDCPDDCKTMPLDDGENTTIVCGDGRCDEGELECQDDCGTHEIAKPISVAVCGNNICEIGESEYCHDDCDKSQKSLFGKLVEFFQKLFRR